MGVELGELLEKEKIELSSLSGRKIAIDAFNTLSQFLSIIRQPDGTPLMDSRGRVTSHLSGLLYRTANVIKEGIYPVYVFDGKPPELKHKTIEERKQVRKKSMEKWDAALERGEKEEARKYAQASSRLTNEMIENSKQLLDVLNVPYVDAPGEGEAQASFMARKGDVWASALQDFDSLLFNSPILIRNLTITGRRKLPRRNVYVMVEPEKIILDANLQRLKITREQLIDIALLMGTDYNEGIKGIGPKTALQYIEKGMTADDVYKQKQAKPEVDLKQLRQLFLKPDVTKKYALKWKKPDDEKVLDLMVNEFDFSQDRVQSALEKIHGHLETKGAQSRLDQWF